MSLVGVRALKQNASAVLREVQAGAIVTITEHGRPIAQMSPLPGSAIDRLIAEGHARPAPCPQHTFSSLNPRPSSKTSSELIEDARGRW